LRLAPRCLAQLQHDMWVPRQTASFIRASQRSALGLFSCLGLAEAHAGAPAVLINELYPAQFKAPPHHFKRCATRLMCARLKLAHGHYADSCLIGELLLAPVKEASSGSTLS
jgi:hypothetical protein